MSVKSILDWMFKLPPVEKRNAPEWFLRGIYGRSATIDPQAIDSCIDYHLVINSFGGCLLISALFLASRILNNAFDLVVFTIDATTIRSITKIVDDYTLYISTVFYGLIIPYYIFCFYHHLKPTSADINHWRFSWRDRKNNLKRIKNWVRFIVLSSTIYGGIRYSGRACVFIMSFKDSVSLFQEVEVLFLVTSVGILFASCQFRLLVMVFWFFSQRRMPIMIEDQNY